MANKSINSLSFCSDTHVFTLPYGECSTAADTAAKTVSVDNFSLEAGATVIVKFTNSNSASTPTLNVNSTGAKPIYRYGTTAASTSQSSSGWRAGAVQMFTYDGTGWVRDFWENSTYSNIGLGHGYATCSTAADTVAKTVSSSSYALSTGGIVAIKFSNAVPANATLNINSKGAKYIYYKGAKITAGIIKAGDIATLMYDGTQYQLLSIDTLQNTFDKVKVGSSTIYSDSPADTLELAAGTNVTLTADTTNDKITIAAADTHYASDIAVTDSANGKQHQGTAITNGNVYLNHIENSLVTSSRKITGSGATTVTTDASGNIIIKSTDTDTKYTHPTSHAASMITGLATVATSGSYNDLSNKPTIPAAYTHPTSSGNKHIPSGGSSGQILRWSADGTATWGAENDTKYTHPTTTARTGVPTADQTPGFGGTFTVNQVSNDAAGHVTAITSRTITIPNTTASTSANGLMSKTDKSKLDGIAAGANAYTHPSYTAKSSGLYKVTVDGSGHVSAATAVTKNDITGLGIPAQDTVYTHPASHPASMITGLATVATSGSYDDLSNKPTIPSTVATTSANGLMAATDKSQLLNGGIPIVTTSGTAPNYTATISGITELKVGMQITIIPHVGTNLQYPTLNLNGLGSKNIYVELAPGSANAIQNTDYSLLKQSRPVTLMYNGSSWIYSDFKRTHVALLYGDLITVDDIDTICGVSAD